MFGDSQTSVCVCVCVCVMVELLQSPAWGFPRECVCVSVCVCTLYAPPYPEEACSPQSYPAGSLSGLLPTLAFHCTLYSDTLTVWPGLWSL